MAVFEVYSKMVMRFLYLGKIFRNYDQSVKKRI